MLLQVVGYVNIVKRTNKEYSHNLGRLWIAARNWGPRIPGLWSIFGAYTGAKFWQTTMQVYLSLEFFLIQCEWWWSNRPLMECHRWCRLKGHPLQAGDKSCLTIPICEHRDRFCFFIRPRSDHCLALSIIAMRWVADWPTPVNRFS